MKRFFTVSLAVLSMAIGLGACSWTVPIGATSNPLGSKRGEASGTGFLNILKFGIDASVATAAKNGGITKISTVDYKTSDILGIVQTYTCIVTGE
jgi:hypothetical protein